MFLLVISTIGTNFCYLFYKVALIKLISTPNLSYQLFLSPELNNRVTNLRIFSLWRIYVLWRQ